MDLLRHRCEPAHLLAELRLHVSTSRSTYRTDWLGDLAPRAERAAFTAAGWDECAATLDAVEAALGTGAEPGAAVGAAWTADAVLGAALYAFLATETHPRHALRRASHTSGASAATAALAGAFAGAHRGPSGWPPEWVEAVEYGERLQALGSRWDRA
ncbi:ADP-ribosylglycohydrolase family protein [Streptomyces venezuelae]|uniref:ADP-ribosylglycohydrolase family protein n=1 Tax=Streptomyces venezuelae TaxID=54571 RepID=UPI0034525F42